MDYRRENNGLVTLLEHWSLLFVTLGALVVMQLMSFLSRLTGMPWIWCYRLAVSISVAGIALIFYARLPLYRRLEFLTFGSAALPESRRGFYRWGYRCVFFAVVLFLGLLWSKP